MTATTSSKKTSYFGKRYKNNFRQNKRAFIIHIIMELLGLPLLAVVGLIAAYLDELDVPYENVAPIYSGCSAFLIVGIICIAISLFLGMTIALNHFNYLYKKSITDMNYALPLSGTQRFFADYLSGFTMYLAPAVGGILLAIAILGIGTPIVGEEIMAEFWENFNLVLRFIFIVLVAMILFYTLSVLSITFCGNTFEAIFSIIAFNVLIPATVACVWVALCQSYPYGIDEGGIFYKNIFTSTSPVGAASFFVMYAFDLSYSETQSFATLLFAKWIIISLIVSAIYLASAYLLYRHRKAEDVSKPYVYKTAFYGIMTMSVFCILSLFFTLDGFLAAGILLCAIGWFIMEVITRRGFRKFWQAGLGFAAAVISVVILCNVFTATKGFGMAKNVPSAASVESVTLYCGDLSELVIRDRKVIEETVKLHEELVDRHFNQENYSYNTVNNPDSYRTYNSEISINYSTYTGSTITRNYILPSGMLGELTKAILLSDEYAKQVYNGMFTYQYNRINGLYGENEKYEPVSIEYIDKTSEYQNKNVEKTDLDAIRLAYYNDLSAMTEDDLLNAKFYGTITDGIMADEGFVLETFENTIAILEELGFKVGDVSPNAPISITFEKYPTFYSDAKAIFEADYSEVNDYYYYSDTNEKTIVDSITSVHYAYHDEGMYTYSNEIAIDLLNRSTKIVLGEKPIAAIIANRQCYYILDRGDNKELLEKLDDDRTVSFKTGGEEYTGWD